MAAYSFEQIQTLMNYGFTADQIMELSRDSPSAEISNTTGEQPQLPQEDQPTDPPAGDNSPAPDPTEDNSSAPDPAEPSALKEIKAELQNLRAAVQKNNILTKTVDSIGNDADAVENILAGIIRPEFKKEA